MTDNLYGPDKPCRRTLCVAVDPVTGAGAGTVANHRGGAHLDPLDRDHYDGPQTAVSAAPMDVRAAVSPILRCVGTYGDIPAMKASPADLRMYAELAVHRAINEIDRLRQQVAHVRVDADRKVRDAARRALDCGDHGKVIADLEAQVAHFEASRDRTEAARLALLGEHQAIRDLLDAHDRGATSEATHPKALMAALRAMSDRTAAAHTRAWNPRKDPAA